MKFVVIFAAFMAYALAAPSTANSDSASGTRQTRQAITNPASTFGNGDSSAFANFGRRLNFVDANRELRELDDDDLNFVTLDSAGRPLTFQSRETSAPLVNRVTSNFGGFTPSGQRLNNLMTFSDNSGEVEDFDDLDDFGLFPFVNRQNPVRLVSRPSIFNPNNQTPIRQINNRFVQAGQNNLRAPATTCTCPPQTVTRFQPKVTQTNPLGQFVRFPQQQSFNPFVHSQNNFATLSSQFPGVQFVFDD